MNALSDSFTSLLSALAEEFLSTTEACSYPNREGLLLWVDSLIKDMFPYFYRSSTLSTAQLASSLAERVHELTRLLEHFRGCAQVNVLEVTEQFFSALSEVYRKLRVDAQTLFESDPAAESFEEVILAYPGFKALASYRVAHLLYTLQVPLLPRIITEQAHQQTGIDIHPGAFLGEGCAIDHGTGVVIGATAVVGNFVKIYQGVTLGALSVKKNTPNIKRHPTIEDRVIIYANATILGGETVIGHDSIIGGNAWVTQSVPPYSKVYNSK